MKMDYPKFQSFWSKTNNEAIKGIKCPQCGKEVSENNQCICPYCGSSLKDVINRKCTTMVQSLISGWVETKYENDRTPLSDEDWKNRITIFKMTSSLIADYSDELRTWAEKEFEPYELKIEKYKNNIWIRILDFIATLFNGGLGMILFLGLVFMVCLFIFNGIISIVFALLGVYFITASIMLIVLDKKSEKPYYNKNWLSSKNEILHTLKNYFIEERFREENLMSSIPKFVEEMGMDEDIKKAEESGDKEYFRERGDWWNMVWEHGKWLIDITALIEWDYQKQVNSKTEKDLPKDVQQQLKDRKKHWDQYYAKHEV